MVRSGFGSVRGTDPGQHGPEGTLQVQFGQEPQLLRRLTCLGLADPSGRERPFTAFGGAQLGTTIFGHRVVYFPFCSWEFNATPGWSNGKEVEFDAISEDVRIDGDLKTAADPRWGRWRGLIAHRRELPGLFHLCGTVRMSEFDGAIIRPIAFSFLPAVGRDGSNLIADSEFEYPGSVSDAGRKLCAEYRHPMAPGRRNGPLSRRTLGALMADQSVVFRRAPLCGTRIGGAITVNNRLVTADRLRVPRYLRHRAVERS